MNMKKIVLLLICALAVAGLCPKAVPVTAGAGGYYEGGDGVSLLINVYEGSAQVAQMLDIFKKYDIRATFFLGGLWAEKPENRPLIERMVSEGHGVGSHGYSHALPTKVGAAKAGQEMDRTSAILEDITGEKCILYAPPSGDYDAQTVREAASRGMITVLWSVDTIDWRDHDAALVQARGESCEAGDFLLLHPKAHTVQALPGIIEALLGRGLCFTTVGQALGMAQ